MLSSIARSGQAVARAAQRSANVTAAARRVPEATRRTMGGHARYIGLPGEHVPIKASKIHETLGTVYLTTMFLWMMYRFKQDGMVLLVSLKLWTYRE